MQTVLYGIVIISLFGATLRWPAAALGGMLCANGVFQWAQTSVPLIAAHPMISNYLIGATMVQGVIILMLRGKAMSRQYPPAGWWTLILFGFAFLSILWALDPDDAITNLRNRGLYIAVTVILSPMLIQDSRDLRAALITTIILGGTLCVVLIGAGNWAGRGLEATSDASVGLNPLGIASLGAYVTVIAALMNFSGIGRVLQILRWGVVAAALLLIILTQTRGQFLVALLMLLLFLPIGRGMQNKWGFIGALFGLMIVGGLSGVLLSTMAYEGRWNVGEMINNFKETRLETSMLVLQDWWEAGPIYWLIGLGNSASFSPSLLGKYPHMVPLEILTEEGLVGFTLFWYIVYIGTRSIARIYRLIKDDAMQRGALAAVGALFWANVILSFKQGSMMQSLDLFLFAILLGRFELAVRDEYVEPAVELAPPPAQRVVYAAEIRPRTQS
ncbi:MAG: hypothetical protein GC162_11140 [Planctomycetes bacterium]|nr:hypothetical protein [Planctomycetota bacterium]